MYDFAILCLYCTVFSFFHSFCDEWWWEGSPWITTAMQWLCLHSFIRSDKKQRWERPERLQLDGFARCGLKRLRLLRLSSACLILPLLSSSDKYKQPKLTNRRVVIRQHLQSHCNSELRLYINPLTHPLNPHIILSIYIKEIVNRLQICGLSRSISLGSQPSDTVTKGAHNKSTLMTS